MQIFTVRKVLHNNYQSCNPIGECTTDTPARYSGTSLTRKVLNHPGASLREQQIAFRMSTQTCMSYSSSCTCQISSNPPPFAEGFDYRDNSHTNYYHASNSRECTNQSNPHLAPTPCITLIISKILNHPGASLSEWQIAFGMPTQTCSYSSSQTTMATRAWAKLHSQAMIQQGNPCYV